MSGEGHLHAADLRGAAKLAIDAVVQTTSLVEGMHLNISRAWPFGPALEGKTSGITGLVYESIRHITGAVGLGLDAVLAPIAAALKGGVSSSEREAVVSALNGVLGDHLEASGNPLAIQMSLRRGGRALEPRREALAREFPQASGRIVVLIHGLCMNDLQWTRQNHEHGAALEQHFGCTTLHLHYNSGRHISSNGRNFAALLETLLREWPVPVEELSLLGHSMGGLVARSACHYAQEAGHVWPAKLKRLVFLGTPHHGAPLERHGNRLQNFVSHISPYVAPLARLGMLRSAGVTDLRHGSLLDQDWQHCERFGPAEDCRTAVPLPPGVRAYALAVTLGRQPRDLDDRWLADGLVPVWSALGEHRDPARDLGIPAPRRWTGYGMNHWDLLSRPEVYAEISYCFGEDPA
jgi:pimeloyl-ACP methyl ester carboxylesterase